MQSEVGIARESESAVWKKMSRFSALECVFISRPHLDAPNAPHTAYSPSAHHMLSAKRISCRKRIVLDISKMWINQFLWYRVGDPSRYVMTLWKSAGTLPFPIPFEKTCFSLQRRISWALAIAEVQCYELYSILIMSHDVVYTINTDESFFIPSIFHTFPYFSL